MAREGVMKWRRYVLHILIVLLVLAAMTGPAWLHTSWRYVLSSVVVVAVVVVAAVAWVLAPKEK
jgi:hypothetical protein